MLGDDETKYEDVHTHVRTTDPVPRRIAHITSPLLALAVHQHVVGMSVGVGGNSIDGSSVDSFNLDGLVI